MPASFLIWEWFYEQDDINFIREDKNRNVLMQEQHSPYSNCSHKPKMQKLASYVTLYIGSSNSAHQILQPPHWAGDEWGNSNNSEGSNMEWRISTTGHTASCVVTVT